MRLAVSIFIQSCLGVLIFHKAKGLKVDLFTWSVFINEIFLSLDIEFQWNNFQISEKKLMLISPKLSEFHKNLQNLPQRLF